MREGEIWLVALVDLVPGGPVGGPLIPRLSAFKQLEDCDSTRILLAKGLAARLNDMPAGFVPVAGGCRGCEKKRENPSEEVG